MVTHINDKADLLSKLTDAGDQLVVIDFFELLNFYAKLQN
jgi:hypothetical protein